MIFLKNYTTELLDEENVKRTLIIRLIKHKNVYGFMCSLGSDNTCMDLNVTNNICHAYDIFNLLCRENVLPAHLLSVLDDIDFDSLTSEEEFYNYKAN